MLFICSDVQFKVSRFLKEILTWRLRLTTIKTLRVSPTLGEGKPLSLPDENAASRVREWHYCHSLPSEPCLQLSSHTAQAFQTLFDKRTSYNHWFNNTEKSPATTFIVRSAQANVSIAYICLLLLTDLMTFLVEKDQHRSLPTFASNDVSIRISAITAKHSLFRLSHTRNSIGLSYGLLSQRENYGFSTFRVNTRVG